MVTLTSKMTSWEDQGDLTFLTVAFLRYPFRNSLGYPFLYAVGRKDEHHLCTKQCISKEDAIPEGPQSVLIPSTRSNTNPRTQANLGSATLASWNARRMSQN